MDRTILSKPTIQFIPKEENMDDEMKQLLEDLALEREEAYS